MTNKQTLRDRDLHRVEKDTALGSQPARDDGGDEAVRRVDAVVRQRDYLAQTTGGLPKISGSQLGGVSRLTEEGFEKSS